MIEDLLTIGGSVRCFLDALSRNDVRPASVVAMMGDGRLNVDEKTVERLADSIRSKGVLLPLIIRSLQDGLWEIVAGERRWRAAKIAGLKTVPCIVRNISNQDALTMALIENIDCKDMSIPDEAEGVKALVDQLGTLKQAAREIGKPESWVSKRYRIASAPKFVTDFMKAGYSRDVEGYYEKDVTQKKPIHNKANGVKSSPIINSASFHNNLLTLNTSEGDYFFEFGEGVRELLLNTLK